MPKTRQVAALPFRQGRDGAIEVCLITTRDTGRWVIPKGWPKAKVSRSAMAAREAYEEAGLKGAIGDKPVGAYRYFKRLQRTFELIEVEVFLLEVTKEGRKWPEAGQRKRAWVSPAEAATLVVEPSLAVLLMELADADVAGGLSKGCRRREGTSRRRS